MNTVKRWYIVLFAGSMIFLILHFVSSHNVETHAKEVKAGREVLKRYENQDVSNIQSKIEAAQKQKRLQRRETGSLKQVYANAVIMGDSMSDALLDYQLLNSSSVVAKRGRTLFNNEEDINTVKQIQPRVLFMQYGMNDMGAFRGDSQYFISKYEEQIKDLQTSIPHVRIFVVSITPMTSKGQKQNENNWRYPEFNDAMKEMCKRLNLKYIDTSFLVDPNNPDFYQFDGVHPTYDYFPAWLKYMADEADL